MAHLTGPSEREASFEDPVRYVEGRARAGAYPSDPQATPEALSRPAGVGDCVQMPLDAARALFAVYDTWWNQVGTTDPGRVLISDGVKLTGVAGLLNFNDDQAMERACVAVEPHVPLLLELLGASRG
jgi:hypothetical protein